MKKIISLFMSILMLMLCVFQINVLADENAPMIIVESVSDSPGATVDVAIKVKNNPGILGATLTFTYDKELTLVDATAGDAFSVLTMTKPGKYTSPCKFTWDGQELSTDDIKDGTILNLKFGIGDSAENGNEYKIKVSYDDGDIVGGGLEPIDVNIENGVVTAIDYMPGDLNGDRKVNPTDIIMLRRFIAGGYDQTINEMAADVNNDGKKNPTDVILIRRYIAGGYNVELLPSTTTKQQCDHELEATAYKAPTCTEQGNIAFWHCLICDKYYNDANATMEIDTNSISIAAAGHTVVVDEAVQPTYDSKGLTEGKHCSVCGEVIVKQEEIPMLSKDQYSITYYIDHNDAYLKSLNIQNPNPLVYSTEDGLMLQDIIVDGYKFKGWYTSQTGGTKVTQIKAGETGNKTLYAQWEKVEYTITFASEMVPVNDMKYTVGEEKSLPKLTLDKYSFVGWSDKENHKLWDSIPAGTTGNITLYANWSSNRNKAVAKSKLDDPLIFEDTDKGIMLFTYELGEIRNVPLYETLNLQCVNGVITTNSVSSQTHIEQGNAKNVAQTISKATTNSASWTLSSEWNKTTEVSESYLEKTGQTREEAETKAKSQNNTYNCSSTTGGSSSNVNTSSGSFRFSENESQKDYSRVDTQKEYELTTNDKLNTELSAEIKGGYGPVSAKVNGKLATETSVNQNYGQAMQTTNVGTKDWSNGLDVSNSYSNSSTDSKSWNSSSGYSRSNQVSTTNTVSNILSKEIATEKSQGQSYSEGGSRHDSQEFASTDSKSDEYSTTVTYHTAEIETKMRSYESTGQTVGNYRIVQAGTMHVYGVVGYDIAQKSYFVYTYNVLDDEVKEYIDYSRDGSFEDYETSIIPFEIPYFVNEYVNNKITKTDGLVFDPDTGMIMDYAPTGDKADNIVVIPSYISVNNNDGTYKSVKVTGIAPGLFKNNKDIVAVQLGKFINEIPESTFEGCSSLQYVLSPGVTKIGKNAFKGCSSLEEFTLPDDIEELGENAFENSPKITATASNVEIAQAVASSGANKITLDISEIPEEESKDLSFEIGNIDTFELIGKDKEYKGLSVKSDAVNTIINGVNFTKNTKIPMELSSENVTLDRVTVDCSGYALVLKADNTNISLNRSVNLISTGENAVISKNVTLAPLSSDIVGKLNLTGNMLVCGNVDGEKYLTFNSGEIKYISDEEYNNYLTSHRIIFNANGGTVSETSKMFALNTEIGELPVPSRDYYTFAGWYTDADGGDKVTAETVMTSPTDFTLYAHWIENDVSAWTLASAVPEDAQIVNRKWTYKQTSYTTSSSSSLSGWTKYDTQWKWSSYGNWSGWSNGSVGSSDSRQVETRTIYKYHYYQCYNCYDHHPYCVNRCDTCGKVGTVLANSYGERWEPINPYSTDHGTWGGNRMWTYFGEHWYANLYFWDSSNVESATQWRYRDRSKIYTYYYKKTESKEASTEPSGDNITNVQEYVQYRLKDTNNSDVKKYKYYYYQCSNCYDHHPYCVNKCETCGKTGTVKEDSYVERWESVDPYDTDHGSWGENYMWTYFGEHWYGNLYFWDSSNIVSTTL